MENVTIQLKRNDSSSFNIATCNYILKSAELFFNDKTGLLYIGDGINTLSYLAANNKEIGKLGINSSLTSINSTITAMNTNITTLQNKIKSGTGTPLDDIGNDGDIYIQYE